MNELKGKETEPANTTAYHRSWRSLAVVLGQWSTKTQKFVFIIDEIRCSTL